jgi:hypothetical protein
MSESAENHGSRGRPLVTETSPPATRSQTNKIDNIELERKAATIPELVLKAGSRPSKWTNPPKFLERQPSNSCQLWGKFNDEQRNYVRTMEDEELKRRREEREEIKRAKRQKTVPAANHEYQDTENREPGSSTEVERASYPTPPFKHLQPLHLTPANGPNRAAHQSGGQPRPTGANTSRIRRQHRFGPRNLNRGEPKESSQQVASHIANELPKVAERVDWLNSECNLGPTKAGATFVLLALNQCGPQLPAAGGAPTQKTMSVAEQNAQSHFTVVAGGEHELWAVTQALCRTMQIHQRETARQAQVTNNDENTPSAANLWPANVTYLEGNSAAHFAKQKQERERPKALHSVQEVFQNLDINHSGNNPDGSLMIDHL